MSLRLAWVSYANGLSGVICWNCLSWRTGVGLLAGEFKPNLPYHRFSRFAPRRREFL